MHVWKSTWWSWRHFYLFCPFFLHNKVRIWLCIPGASDIISVTVYSESKEESSTEIQQEKGRKKKDFTKIHEG